VSTPIQSRRSRAPRLAPEDRRSQLLDVSLELLVEQGFGAINVEAVARRAGVTRPVVYDMFGDLDGLLHALLDRAEHTALDPLMEIVGEVPTGAVDPEQFLFDAVLAFLRAVKADPKTWRLILFPPRGSSPELRERIQSGRLQVADRVQALLEWGVPLRGGPPTLDRALGARLIVAGGEDAARLMLAHPRRFPPGRLAGMVRDGLALIPADVVARGVPMPVVSVPPPAVAQPASVVAGRRMPQSLRRQQLLDVTLALLAEEGFDALSIEAIARRAGVNRTVIYRSFANVNVLLVALLRREDRRIQRVLEQLLPRDIAGRDPAALLGETLGRFLSAVVARPQTWRVALLRPESAPLAVQKLVNRRRTALARRLEPLVSWGIGQLPGGEHRVDAEVLARMLLCVGEEEGRLALDDPAYPVERLMRSTWELLDLLPVRGG
jgi:AcrR family transcriptional regulator